MRIRGLLDASLAASLAGALACASPPPPAAGPSASAPAAADTAGTARPLPVGEGIESASSAPAPFVTACREACGQRNMMRAVSAAMIDAQCESTCADAWALPEVRDRAAAKAHQGQAVRARGRYVVTEEGRHLRLDDGGELVLSGGPALARAPAVEAGAAVIVVGTVEGTALSDVTVIALD